MVNKTINNFRRIPVVAGMSLQTLQDFWTLGSRESRSSISWIRCEESQMSFENSDTLSSLKIFSINFRPLFIISFSVLAFKNNEYFLMMTLSSIANLLSRKLSTYTTTSFLTADYFLVASCNIKIKNSSLFASLFLGITRFIYLRSHHRHS